MAQESDPVHAEINLVRLMRRLEKAAVLPEDWEQSDSATRLDLWIQTQSGVQKIKFARKLLRDVELYDDTPPTRAAKINYTKTRLDKLESFFQSASSKLKPVPQAAPSFLSNVPIPIPDQPDTGSQSSSSPTPDGTESVSETESDDGCSTPRSAPLTSISTAGLSIAPPSYEEEMSPTLITSLLPLPATEEKPASTSYKRPSNPESTSHLRHGTTALHEELASQLEVMAAQLKRNAIHTSTSLARDRAVLEDVGQKVEVNHDVMTKERTRLRDHSSKSSGTTWLSLGIILLVLAIFVVMIGLIRFSRF